MVYEVELATMQRKGDADFPEASSPRGHCRVLRDLSPLCSPHRRRGDPRAEAELSFVHLPTIIPPETQTPCRHVLWSLHLWRLRPHPTWLFHCSELHETWEQEHFLVCSNQLNKKVPRPLQVGGHRAQTLCKWWRSLCVDLSFRLAEGGQLTGRTEAWTSVWTVDWVLALRLPPGKQGSHRTLNGDKTLFTWKAKVTRVITLLRFLGGCRSLVGLNV